LNSSPLALSVFFDNSYLFPTLVMLGSAHENIDSEVEFILGTFEGELSSGDKDNISLILDSLNRTHRFIEISKDDVAARATGIDLNQHFGYAALGKIEILNQIPLRHIYSDVDVLFLEGSNSFVEKLEESNRVGFVPQISALRNSGFKTDDGNYEFFSGFILWPKKEDRPMLEIGDFRTWKTKHSTHDQALLNQKIGHDYLKIRAEFCQLDSATLRTSDFGPGIVHYFGNWKPWHAWLVNRKQCEHVGCAWSIWFSKEGKSLELAKRLNLGRWWMGKRRRSLRGASTNLKRLQLVMSVSRFLLLNPLMRKIVKNRLSAEYHLIH
jgi:lipopolysaccharide biosynthesis glycosyltransferase